jgi:SAM-dependent methyltransferase
MSEPCPVCRSRATRITYALTGYRIAQCDSCRFEFHDGFRGGGGEEGTFSQDYYEGVQREAFEAQFGDYMKDPSVPVYDRWLSRIEERMRPGKILDVGSALGTFLKVAEKRGWKPEGVEISRFASDFAREKRGLTVFNGDLEQFPGESGSFDAITFWDSIEHVTHPEENLRTAVRLLRPGGVMLVATDNFDCLVGDVARVAYRASFGAIRYPMERVFISPNRSFFTDGTLRAVLSNCGAKVVVLEKMEYPLDKIRTNWAERLILKSFYGAAHVLGRQAQVTVLAEKS